MGTGTCFLEVKIDKKNISFGENELRGQVYQVNNSVIFGENLWGLRSSLPDS